jgi:hypothetical protein
MPLPKGLHDGLSVFTQEETKLVRATAVLFDLDVQCRPLKLRIVSTRVFSRLTVPVYEGEVKVGAATVFDADNKIMALISFDYNTPERFDLSIGRPIYAIPRGYYCLDPAENVVHNVDFIDIRGIDLSNTPSKEEGRGSRLNVTEYNQLGE